MTFKKERIENFYFSDTSFENIFIDEYMPDAEGDHVKVFIFAYMQADLGRLITNEDIADKLSMDVEDVRKAWNYWEKNGLVRKCRKTSNGDSDYDIEFINMKDTLFGKSDKPNNGTSITHELDDKEIAGLFHEIEKIVGRPISGVELDKIASLITDYDARPDLISFAYKYCKEKGKSDDKNYIFATAVNWRDKGINTAEEAKKQLEEMDGRYRQYKLLMQKLGLNNSTVTDSEKDIFDSWLDTMGFGMEEIFEAINKSAGINGKLKYVNAILRNQYQDRNGEGSAEEDKLSMSARQKYYAAVKEKNQQDAEKRKEEIFEKIPRIKDIEEEIRNKLKESGMALVSGAPNRQEVAKRIKSHVEELMEEKANLLRQENFSENYMDVMYNCNACKDTGLLDNGANCDCYEKTLGEV